MVEPITEIVLEAPAGLIRIRCTCEDGKVTSVEFENQPAFAYEIGVPLELEGYPTLTVDVAWGGMAYVLADAAELGIGLTADEARELCDLGQRLKTAAAEQIPVVHPTNPEFAGITQTEIVGPLARRDGVLTARNAVIVSPGRLDRSPCGTGTSARLSVLHAKGLIDVGEPFIHESVIGSQFTSRIDRLTTVGNYDAVIPRVAGQAFITELSQVGLDPPTPTRPATHCPIPGPARRNRQSLVVSTRHLTGQLCVRGRCFHPETEEAAKQDASTSPTSRPGWQPGPPRSPKKQSDGPNRGHRSVTTSVPFEQVQARDRKAITQPVLIANGIEGIMIPAIASYTAIGHLQNAKLVLYSGSGEEFLFQHAKDFATEVTNFLSTWQNSTCTSSSPPL